MDLRDYLRILRRRWALVLAGLLLGTAAGALLVLGATPLYSSTARLFVSTPGADSANAQMYQGSLFSQQRVTSYADLIEGSTVAERVVARLGSDESASEVVSQISAAADPDSVILRITATDPDPARAQLIAQTTALVFAEYVAELESADDPANSPIKANIVDAANLPTSPVYPRPVVTVGLGAIIGLLVGLAAAWLREALDTTIKSVEDVQRLTGAALLGSIFYDPDAAKRPLISGLDSNAPRVESFRVLATNLQFLDVDKHSNAYTVTSPLPGDGKSTTSINIALALAEVGKRTLLLEADLRRPKFEQYLNLESSVGLTTVLIGKAELADAIQPWGRAGLDVITSGALPPNPAELLQSQAMTSVMQELRARYEVIIVDAPPVLPITDAALIAARTSGAILVLRHGRTTRDQAAQARNRLDSVGASVLGSVFNFLPQRAMSTYGYGYGYGYAPEYPAGQEPATPAEGATDSSREPDPAVVVIRSDGADAPGATDRVHEPDSPSPGATRPADPVGAGGVEGRRNGAVAGPISSPPS